MKFILSKKGSSGHSILKINDDAKEPIAAANAPAGVALFQNMPIKKMATTPGVTKPVYS